MNRISKTVSAIAAGALMAASLVVPASAAAPWAPQRVQTTRGNVVLAQYRHRREDRMYMHHGEPYYRGHRGYRHYRHGYHHYQGYWFPPAAFVAGSIVGGAIAAEPHRGGRAHVRWCESHYRSYDVRTDSYQPYHGPRRRCVSPY